MTALAGLSVGVLLLADGRSPTGGLSHSGGVEAAVRAGVVFDEESLLSLLQARLATAGRVAAGLAAAAFGYADDSQQLMTLDMAADARMPSAAARLASRTQGRGLLRLARSCWPHPAYARAGPLGARPHHCLVLGVAVCAGGGRRFDAASVTALASVSGPASAAVRLLGLDPIAVTTLIARLAPTIETLAGEVAADPDLPTAGHPLLDIFAEQHAAHPATLFTS